MTKRSFVTLILSLVGGLLLAFGMCMCLIEDWNAFRPGVICAALGVITLLVMVVYRTKTRKAPIRKPTKHSVAVICLAVFGALTLGLGICLIMAWGKIVAGIILGMIGIISLVMLIPLIKGIKPD